MSVLATVESSNTVVEEDEEDLDPSIRRECLAEARDKVGRQHGHASPSTPMHSLAWSCFDSQKFGINVKTFKNVVLFESMVVVPFK
ncbi:hypothetical protein JHK87_001512 [Glycine soja]|nr:hypothetical protein JHK87_001512 [Glycine soja]